LFEAAVKEWHLSPTLVAVALIQLPKRVAKTLAHRVHFSIETMREILLAFKEGTLAKEGILPTLMQVATGREFSRHALSARSTEGEFTTALARSTQELAGIRLRHVERKHDVLMGLVMNKVRGRVDGRIVSERLGGSQTEKQK
jgi:Glu-tRNA(Gln) amidotransferase subunit E-like FAD-binding protein